MRKKLLLVDDEAALLETMKELLLFEDDSLDITLATNGLDALDLLALQKFDCVVSDIKMPVLDGFSLLRKVQELGLGVPFIFYSGHACEDLARRARELGALHTVAKPDFARIEAAIKETLHSRGRLELPA
jgi:two-component system response regulator YesN